MEHGSGPVALFVHGVLLNRYLWRHQLDGLSDIRRCIAVDLLAHGDTEITESQDVSVTANAKMLRELLDVLKIDQVDLVGNDYLRAVDWADHETRMNRLLRVHYGTNGFSLQSTRTPNGVTDAISKYFQGDLAAIDTLPVITGGTSFQDDVWRALRDIPCGTTVSYMNLAKHIGRPSAIRAVGSANGSNPVGIVVPCHRVIGSDGSPTGYGGEIEHKLWLLNHEANVPR